MCQLPRVRSGGGKAHSTTGGLPAYTMCRPFSTLPAACVGGGEEVGASAGDEAVDDIARAYSSVRSR